MMEPKFTFLKSGNVLSIGAFMLVDAWRIQKEIENNLVISE